VAYDCIVIGLGAMGGAALHHLAQRGVRVLGIEQFDIGHDRGSSHGQTRIIRKAYFEHPDYVPLLHRAYDLWAEVERQAGRELFRRTGLLLVGRPEGDVLSGVRRAADSHRLPIERLSRASVLERFGGFLPDEDMEGLYEADAGYLLVEDAVRTHVELAVAAGAVIETGCAVREWSADGRGVRVITDAAEYEAERLIIAGGAWAGRLLRELALPLSVLRKVQLWLATDDSRYDVDGGCPVFCFDAGDAFYYGFPAIEPGALKVAEHSGREVVEDPIAVDRELHERDVQRVRAFAARYLPGVGGEVVRHSTCLYTMTPDGHFVIDRHPRHEHVVFAGGFSGHGFKFAPIVGSVLADLVLNGSTREPIEFLRLGRPGVLTVG
jgi:sarcosine oxidase